MLLHVLPLVEVTPKRVDPPARPIGVVLIDLTGDSVLPPQSVRTPEPGDPRADDDDPLITARRSRGRMGEPSGEHDAGTHREPTS
jgi:hypothetical protein